MVSSTTSSRSCALHMLLFCFSLPISSHLSTIPSQSPLLGGLFVFAPRRTSGSPLGIYTFRQYPYLFILLDALFVRTDKE